VFSPAKLTVLLAIVASLAFAATATAGNGQVQLSAPKVAVDYTHCYNGSTPLPCWAVNFTISNKTSNDVNCSVMLVEDQQTVFDYTVPAGTSSYGGGFTKGYVAGTKYLTLSMSCHGTNTYTSSVRVHVTGV
jgi:hypothetical protein